VVEGSDFEATVDAAFRRLGSRIRDCKSGRDAVLPSALEYRRLGEHFMRSSKLRNKADVARYEGHAVVESPSASCFAGAACRLSFRSSPNRRSRATRSSQSPEAGETKPVIIENKTPCGAKSSENVAAYDTRRIMDALVVLEGQPLMVVEKKGCGKSYAGDVRLIILLFRMEEVKQHCAGHTIQMGEEQQRAATAVALVIQHARGCEPGVERCQQMKVPRIWTMNSVPKWLRQGLRGSQCSR
jgi:hypothetical protein